MKTLQLVGSDEELREIPVQQTVQDPSEIGCDQKTGNASCNGTDGASDNPIQKGITPVTNGGHRSRVDSVSLLTDGCH